MARLGVIDLGSNSVRLVVYETKREDAAKPFRTLVDEKKMAGLAAYVTDGALSSAGIARAVTVLSDLLKLADNLNCARVDIFATAVLRNCANSEAATAAIEAAIDHKVRVLSAREEAHLGYAYVDIVATRFAHFKNTCHIETGTRMTKMCIRDRLGAGVDTNHYIRQLHTESKG